MLVKCKVLTAEVIAKKNGKVKPKFDVEYHTLVIKFHHKTTGANKHCTCTIRKLIESSSTPKYQFLSDSIISCPKSEKYVKSIGRKLSLQKALMNLEARTNGIYKESYGMIMQELNAQCPNGSELSKHVNLQVDSSNKKASMDE